MPLQNRVTPEGEIVAEPARGLMMGNRGGRLHDETRTLGRRRWASKQWIACRLDFRGRRREVMGPRSYTELFFLDEATALAAGHRPCFECRREDARAFAAAWAKAQGGNRSPTAAEMDRVLHGERLTPAGDKGTFRTALGHLPDGAMIRDATGPRLLIRDLLMRWTPAGYCDPVLTVPALIVEILTPPSIIAVLKSGYAAMVHETALASR